MYTPSLPPIGKVDHDIILVNTAMEPLRSKPQRREILLWKRANMDATREEIKQNRESTKGYSRWKVE